MQDDSNITYVDDVGATPIHRNGKRLAGDEERLILNVGGVRHETHVSTLRTIEDTRLARLAERHVLAKDKRGEYFFDRHPAVFNSVIDYYRTGRALFSFCGKANVKWFLSEFRKLFMKITIRFTLLYLNVSEQSIKQLWEKKKTKTKQIWDLQLVKEVIFKKFYSQFYSHVIHIKSPIFFRILQISVFDEFILKL